MPRPADAVGVPPHMTGRPCATQHRSGECGAYHAGGPVQKTAPAGRKGISAIPVRDMVGGGPEIRNAAEIPHVPIDTAPDASEGGCAIRTGAPEEQAGAPHTHPGHIWHTHHKRTAVYRSCGIVDSAPRHTIWRGDFAHIIWNAPSMPLACP